ncbi:MAG TPA: AMP-binding protein [Pirellulales bacterium]|jgi:fatty-acyl-CoA synthase|nr:AMP-binding protein [Pirellulales bacterium]
MEPALTDRPPLPWVERLTIAQALTETARLRADRDALVFPALGLKLSYRQFAARVDAAARGLLALGIEQGQHVAVWGTNVPEWVILQFATARIGAILVTINPAYRPFELGYVLRQSDAVALFLVERFKSSDYFAMLAEVCPVLAAAEPGQLECEAFPRLRWVVSFAATAPAGAITWASLEERGRAVPACRLEEIGAGLRPDQPINIQYTSGTTGFPKAATLSHHNLLMNAFYVGECQRLTVADRICIPVPFYHCFGCVLGTLCAVVHGAAMIIPAPSFDARATLDAIECERATAVYGVPTMYIAQLQEQDVKQRDLRSLRTGIMSGSPCPIEIMKQVVDRMGVREITIAYGQTEASPVITQTRVDDPLVVRVETVGKPLPGVEVKIVDPATGAVQTDNQSGELCARGHVVMLGYYKNPEATRAAIDSEGWLHTGDLALRLPSGYYRITGRLKDLVIRGGENIYPREIEEFLFTHPAVEQVSVVGVPDKKFVEELCAWIKPKAGCQPTADEIRQFCRGRLAHYKVPRYVKFVDSFPQTVTGKIQKYKIRESMIVELKLEESETA